LILKSYDGENVRRGHLSQRRFQFHQKEPICRRKAQQPDTRIHEVIFDLSPIMDIKRVWQVLSYPKYIFAILNSRWMWGYKNTHQKIKL